MQPTNVTVAIGLRFCTIRGEHFALDERRAGDRLSIRFGQRSDAGLPGLSFGCTLPCLWLQGGGLCALVEGFAWFVS
jgi:hypothetical protein